MTLINFITTLSAKQHRALQIWWRFSLGILFGVIASIIVLQSIQLYALYTTVSEHKHLQARASAVRNELEPYTALKKEEEALRAQRAKIDHIYHTAERMSTLLGTLCATNQSLRVQSCKLNKTDFNLVVHCANTESALQEVKRLRAVKQLDAVKLVSLQQMQQGGYMAATIQGKLRKT